MPRVIVARYFHLLILCVSIRNLGGDVTIYGISFLGRNELLFLSGYSALERAMSGFRGGPANRVDRESSGPWVNEIIN